jgi:hypothetical protein
MAMDMEIRLVVGIVRQHVSAILLFTSTSSRCQYSVIVMVVGVVVVEAKTDLSQVAGIEERQWWW